LSREKYVNTNFKQKSITQKKNISHPENPDISMLGNAYALPTDFPYPPCLSPLPPAGGRGDKKELRINFLNLWLVLPPEKVYYFVTGGKSLFGH
jgi:hypothetical protein